MRSRRLTLPNQTPRGCGGPMDHPPGGNYNYHLNINSKVEGSKQQMTPDVIEANGRPLIALATLTRRIGSLLLLVVINAAPQSCGEQRATLKGHSLALA